MGSVIVYICLRLSECMNPFLYNMASTKMRKASVRAIGQMLYCVCRYRWGVWRRQNTRRATRRTLTTSPNRQCQSDPSIFTSLQANSKMDHRPSSPGRRAQLNEKTKIIQKLDGKTEAHLFLSRTSSDESMRWDSGTPDGFQ